jgi:hypothetical protein
VLNELVCRLYGVRAEMLPPGSPEFLDPELFLAWRAQDCRSKRRV